MDLTSPVDQVKFCPAPGEPDGSEKPSDGPVAFNSTFDLPVVCARIGPARELREEEEK